MKKLFYRPKSNELKLFNLFSTRHPVFNLLGLRGFIVQHTIVEDEILKKYAMNLKVIVEIGVAEGGSAYTFSSVMSEHGDLYLIDCYTSGRLPFINLTNIVAKRLIKYSKTGCRIHWMKMFSYEAVKSWSKSIDLLFIDGDHSFEGCLKDWEDWNKYVKKDGYVLFHDARIFKDGWTRNEWGPVKFVNKYIRNDKTKEWKIVEERDSIVVVKKIGG